MIANEVSYRNFVDVFSTLQYNFPSSQRSPEQGENEKNRFYLISLFLSVYLSVDVFGCVYQPMSGGKWSDPEQPETGEKHREQ